MTLWAVGGLEASTRELARMTPPDNVQLRLSVTEPLGAESLWIPQNAWLVTGAASHRRVFRTACPSWIAAGQSVAQRSGSESERERISAIELTYDKHVQQQQPTTLAVPLVVEVVERTPYASGAGRPGVYVSAPGPDENKLAGFLPISLAMSFFFMWTFSTAGQPSNMVRLMAFDNSKTLRRAIFTVSIYYSLIYFPLVIIFCSARVLLPGWETEPDRIMPEMAKLTSALCGQPWLAGLLVAAPFAAVMSTMDSFLLMISSAVVRDLYQRNFNPAASERTIKRLTYATTLAVGTIAMLAAVSPPKFLQDIIVFTGTGLATCFLVPMFLLLYWPRYNLPGALGGLWSGFATHVGLYLIGTLQHPNLAITAWEPFGFHPLLCGIVVSWVVAVAVTWSTPPPADELIRKYFGPPT
jgi:Na+/proline symporter